MWVVSKGPPRRPIDAKTLHVAEQTGKLASDIPKRVSIGPDLPSSALPLRRCMSGAWHYWTKLSLLALAVFMPPHPAIRETAG